MSRRRNTHDDVLRRIQRLADSSCWTWIGTKDRDGYGSVRINGRIQRVHRYMYEYYVGPIPDGMSLDHNATCGKACCNPAHLRPATMAEQHAWRSKATHCKRGHEFTPQNTYQGGNGERQCLECKRMRSRTQWRSGVRDAAYSRNTTAADVAQQLGEDE